MHQEQLRVLQRKQAIENNRTIINCERNDVSWLLFFIILFHPCYHGATEALRIYLFIYIQLIY